MIPCRSRSSPKPGRSDGVILVLALVIALVLSVIILTFHSTTMQSKLEVSRAYLGDVSLYLAEAAAEEGMASIQAQANRPDTPWYQRFQEGTPAQNAEAFELEELATTGDSELARQFGVELSARARILVLGLSAGSDPREKVGSIEVEGRAKVALGRKGSVARRVIIRRDFKGVYLTGQNPLSDYTLYVKDIRGMDAVAPSAASPDQPLLIVKNRPADGGSGRLPGCVYLGQGPNPSPQRPVLLLPPGRQGLIPQEIKYLQGVKLALSASNPQRYQLGQWDATAGAFNDDAVDADKARAIIEDMLHTLRGPDGQPFAQNQIDAVTARCQGAKMRHEVLANDSRSAGLDIYINDPGSAIEGNIFYPYWFRRVFEFQFEGSAPPSNPATQAAVPASAVSFLNGDPNGADRTEAPLAHASGLTGLDNREERLRTASAAMAFTSPRFYSRVFSKLPFQPDPAAAFKRRYLHPTSTGTSVLVADGIVGVIGDLTLEGDVEVRGQGVILALGKIVVKGSIAKGQPTDQLFLVARGGSVTLPGGKKVAAHVQGLNLHPPDQTCVLEVADGGPLDLHGGLAVDRLDSGRFRAVKNLIEYDERLSDWIFHTTFSERVFLWAARADEDSGPKEFVDD